MDAAVFVLGWFLGDAPFSVKNMTTGAMSTSVYRADVNLDREFDEKDTVADKNLFCLISPVSFSCGNLVPAALKSSQKVTLVGQNLRRWQLRGAACLHGLWHRLPDFLL